MKILTTSCTLCCEIFSFLCLLSGLVGLAIAYALSTTGRLSGLVTSFTETEKEMVSVERVSQYIEGAPNEDNEVCNGLGLGLG